MDINQIITEKLNKAIDADLHKKNIAHNCQQCGQDMGSEWLLGAVCGKCCRANHRKVTRR